jgi:hypothetical protein
MTKWSDNAHIYDVHALKDVVQCFHIGVVMWLQYSTTQISSNLAAMDAITAQARLK